MAALDSKWLTTLLGRREVLAGFGALGAAAVLPRCSCGPMQPPPMTAPFDAFRSLRDLVRASPDHLAARAAQVIASKDFTGAVRFVRDAIAVLPPAYPNDAATDGVRWGPDATLRAGAGTQRERAELLKAMLNAMGATARLRAADRPAGVDAAALYATKPPKFVLDTSKLAALGPDVASAFAHVNDPYPDPDSSGVVSSLLALIPSAQAVAKNPYDGLDNRVPVVEYAVNGTTRWAFALGAVDEVAAMPSGLGTFELLPAVYPKVQVRLLAATGGVTGAPLSTTPLELASGSWTADQLAGSRLVIALPFADPSNTVGAPPDQVPLRVPTISIVQPAVLHESDPKLWSPSVGGAAPAGVNGPPVTLFGAQFSAPAQMGAPAQGPFGAFAQLDATAHAAALASVTSLSVEANGGAFPDVQLSVTSLDGGGNAVYGLTQADFAVTDEGAGETAVMISNAGVENVKVLLSYDCSGSVTWPMPSDKMAFDSGLANAMVAAGSPNPYRLATVTLGSSGGPNGYVAPDANAIESVVSSCVSFSPIWQTLGQLALQDGASLVVLVSDFQVDDDPAAIAAFQQRLAASGLSVAMIPVSTPDPSTISAIQGLCNAVVLDHAAPTFGQQLTDFVSSVVAKAKRTGYRMAYALPSAQQTNQTTRTARVALASRAAVAGSAAYTVPPMGSRGNLGLTGLYLELSVGPTTSRRWLAGAPLDGFGNPRAPVPADFEVTRALADGIICVAFEPGNPTEAASAEDSLASVLSFQPYADAVTAGKSVGEGLVAGSQIQLYASALAQLVGVLPTAATDLAIAPLGLRVVISTDVLTAAHGHTRRFDVVPDLNVSGAGTGDAGAAFGATLRRTVELSLRESAVSAGSAAGALSGVALQYLAPSAAPSMLTGFTAANLAAWGPVFDQYGNWHRLVPTTAAPGAMWIVDRNTGTAVAVRIDGTGGSCMNDVAAQYLNFLGLMCSYAQNVCPTGMQGFQCVGAITASFALSSLSAFVIQPLDGKNALDVMALVFSMLSNILQQGGFLLSMATTLYSLATALPGLTDDCA